MKRLLISYFILFLIYGTGTCMAQGYVELQRDKTQNISGIDVNYQTFKRKTKKGEDYYRITVTLTNTGSNWIRIFPEAIRQFIKNDRTAIAHFRFENATGRGFSATSGRIFPQPIFIKVPISVKKCPPPKNPKVDPFNHYLRTYVAGIQFLKGTTSTKNFNIRVREGAVPRVQVLIQ